MRSDLAAVVARPPSGVRGRARGPPAPPSERTSAAAHAHSLRAINDLASELGRKANLFADDAAFLEEVATGAADAPAMQAAVELNSLQARFDAFTADFNARMAKARSAVGGDAAPVGVPSAKPARRGMLGLIARAGE